MAYTVYWESSGIPQKHKYLSRSAARTAALQQQRITGGFVTIMSKGIEVDSVGPNGASWLSRNMSAGAKRAKRASKNPNVHTGRVHADRFYDYDELPPDEQRHHEWAADSGHQFVRYKGKRGSHWIPLENFSQLPSGTSPSGRKADGFATDSYFSGTAIKLIPQRSGSDHDYQVWLETW